MTSTAETAVQDRDLELLESVAQVAEELRREIEKRIIGQHEVVEGSTSRRDQHTRVGPPLSS